MLVLVLGDLHSPYRKPSLPVEFKKFLISGRIQHILCTGNLCTRTVTDYLRSICSDLHLVRGDFDYLINAVVPGAPQVSSSALMADRCCVPEQKLVTIDGIKIGLCHGHQVLPWSDKNALRMLAQQLDVDVLITGHSHKFHVFEADKRIFLNPGSATGAFGSLEAMMSDASNTDCNLIGQDEQGVPSFILMNIEGHDIEVYVYSLVDGEVKVQKSTLTRP